MMVQRDREFIMQPLPGPTEPLQEPLLVRPLLPLTPRRRRPLRRQKPPPPQRKHPPLPQKQLPPLGPQ
jgi:hypothetical protein